MFDSGARPHPFERVQVKTLVLVVVALMAAYVIYHNESFLVNSAAPVWKHYAPFKWWLLGHGLAGVSALVLAPMQFSDRLRQRFTKLHRITGRVYVAAAFILAPLGAYIQYLDEAQGASWTFTVETLMQASLLMITTGVGFVFALKRMIPQHRQWMTRSYAVALTFLEIRVILGLTGWDTPFNWEIVETVVMVCVGSSILVGDIANQVYELRSMRSRPARAQRQAA